MPPNRFESEVESVLEGSHGDRTHIKRADHPRLHHYAGRYSAMLSRLVREKVRSAWPDVCVSAKKFALHARNTPKSAFLRLLGELFRGSASGGAVLGEFFRANRPCAQVL